MQSEEAKQNLDYEFCALSLADFMFLVTIFRMDGNRAASKRSEAANAPMDMVGIS